MPSSYPLPVVKENGIPGKLGENNEIQKIRLAMPAAGGLDIPCPVIFNKHKIPDFHIQILQMRCDAWYRHLKTDWILSDNVKVQAALFLCWLQHKNPISPFLWVPFSDIHRLPDSLHLVYLQFLSIVSLKSIPLTANFNNASSRAISYFKFCIMYFSFIILYDIFKISLPHQLLFTQCHLLKDFYQKYLKPVSPDNPCRKTQFHIDIPSRNHHPLIPAHIHGLWSFLDINRITTNKNA